MSIYGDLSKPQRAFLDNLFSKRAVSIDTAVSSIPAPQLRRSLTAKGLAEFGYHDGYVWKCCLTPAGSAVLASRDYSHVGGSRQRRITYR